VTEDQPPERSIWLDVLLFVLLLIGILAARKKDDDF
jgi:hypothetical protein